MGYPKGSQHLFRASETKALRRKLRLIKWILSCVPPIFFANHRHELAEFTDLLTQYSGATNGPSTQLLRNLRLLGDERLVSDRRRFRDPLRSIVRHSWPTNTGGLPTNFRS
eukprot:Blabericola_migrator_1__5260@NODE_2701_length_2443_cov_21_801347_g1689_i0_p1_GENE_NODE_2701_length_2443_cov_21_801347_g1689_i0NODE_2701_length_2443_cov_21_801347_g1689_i0_p1_ORF_typecomplete_len111_score2_85_NODE_2701_length_2443_cov_21_801347_g1689_i012171549